MLSVVVIVSINVVSLMQKYGYWLKTVNLAYSFLVLRPEPLNKVLYNHGYAQHDYWSMLEDTVNLFLDMMTDVNWTLGSIVSIT